MHLRWEIAIKERPKKQNVLRVHVSLNRRGEIAMNDAAFERIGRPATVTIMYDRANRSIGVKFPVPADRHFFSARRYGRGGKMRIVRAARALKQFGIEIERTISFSRCDGGDVQKRADACAGAERDGARAGTGRARKIPTRYRRWY